MRSTKVAAPFLLAILLSLPALGTERLWVYASANFQVERSVDDLIALLERAKKAGYDAAVVTDYKFGNFDGRPDHFYRNLKRTKAAADRVGIELVPCVMPIGYSGSILQNNPDLAEGIPVRRQTLRVRGGLAEPVGDNLLPGGDFERPAGRAPHGFDWADRSTRDTEVKHGGTASLRLDKFRDGNDHGNARLVKTVALKPWQAYHLRMWVKTRGLDNPAEFGVKPLLPGNRSLNAANLGVKRDQDWTRHDLVFNSREFEQAKLYIGLWAGRGGTIWIDDISLRPSLGVNLLRRDGCPVRFETADGTRLVEGKDLEPWTSPSTGRVPWPGEFKPWHSPPPLRVLADGRLRDGDTLHASYYHTQTIYDGQVCACLKHPEVDRHLARQVEALQRYWSPQRFYMQHDEIRLAGQCGLCESAENSGVLLADQVRRSQAIIKKVNPKAEILVWSDMFDPHHNARDKYYLARGTFAGSWEGLEPSVVIGNWNHGRPADSFAFFAGRGHAQIIAGYYDRGNFQANIERWRAAAAKAGKPIDGFMYTTWRNRYADLEAFAAAVRAK